MTAASPADRLVIVENERCAIAASCAEILSEDELLRAFPEFSPLAQAAVKALSEGHYQPAQALAVNIIESFVREWVDRRYKQVKQHALDADPANADPDAPFNPMRMMHCRCSTFTPIGSLTVVRRHRLGCRDMSLSTKPQRRTTQSSTQ